MEDIFGSKFLPAAVAYPYPGLMAPVCRKGGWFWRSIPLTADYLPSAPADNPRSGQTNACRSAGHTAWRFRQRLHPDRVSVSFSPLKKYYRIPLDARFSVGRIPQTLTNLLLKSSRREVDKAKVQGSAYLAGKQKPPATASSPGALISSSLVFPTMERGLVRCLVGKPVWIKVLFSPRLPRRIRPRRRL